MPVKRSIFGSVGGNLAGNKKGHPADVAHLPGVKRNKNYFTSIMDSFHISGAS